MEEESLWWVVEKSKMSVERERVRDVMKESLCLVIGASEGGVSGLSGVESSFEGKQEFDEDVEVAKPLESNLVF